MFANGWAIAAGAFAVTLPVVIHWLTRPRPARMPVSTLRFIRGAIEQRRSRYRLRNFLILVLRSLAILMLAAAIARPLLHHQQTASATEAAAVTRIVLLDCSQSMGARDGGIVRFERARPAVAELLKFEPSLKSNLLLAAAWPDAVFDVATSNLGALREALQKAKVRPERLRTQLALNQAAEMYGQSDAGSRPELVIVSDFQRSNWATADFSVLPKDCKISLRSITSNKDADNLAVLEFAPQGRVEAGREAEVSVRVGNYSDTPQHVRVEVRLNNAVIPFEGQCAARSTVSIGGGIPVNGEGWHFGVATLMDASDALPDDDQLAIGLQAHPAPRIAIVSRDRPDQVPSALYYIDRALTSAFAGAAGGSANNTATVGSDSQKRAIAHLDAADPDVEILRQSDVIVLARPGRLSADTITVLTAMLQRGRSLLYVAGDQLDAANVKDLLQLLGSSAQLPVEFLPRPSSRSQTARFLTDVNRRQAPFSVFGDELASAVKSLEFHEGLLTRPTSVGLKDDVRASLSDQSAFLTVTSVGRGRLAIMNADLERSNIARTPILVPLLGELMFQELTTTDSRGQGVVCGEPFSVQLSVGEERMADLKTFGPGAAELAEQDRGQLVATPAGVVWELPKPAAGGVYQVQLEGRPIGAVIASIPAEESDLRALTEDFFAGRLSGGRQLTYSSGSVSGEDRQDDLWVWLAAGCLICLLLELVTLRMFRT